MIGGRHGVYMDYQASTPTDVRVLDAMRPFLEGPASLGNPHATEHGYGWDADDAVENARAKIAALIGADTSEVIFTSGATESNNLALLGAARAAAPMRREVVVSAIEHKCVLAAARALADEGFTVRVAPAQRDGVVDLDALARLIGPATAIVSLMAVNNETGVVQPVVEAGAIAKASGALFHTDAAQALVAGAVDVDAWGVDLMSLSAHKIYGPKGIGVLYVRRERRSRVRPLMFGGGQEDGLRPGTLPTPLCVGFGAACGLLASEGAAEVKQIQFNRDRLHDLLKTELPDIVLNGTLADRHPGNLNIRIPGIDAELLLAAARPRLAAATGSACTSGLPEPSHVLVAMGLTSDEARESVRLSLGRFTKPDDLTEVTSALVAAAEVVRQGREQ